MAPQRTPVVKHHEARADFSAVIEEKLRNWERASVFEKMLWLEGAIAEGEEMELNANENRNFLKT